MENEEQEYPGQCEGNYDPEAEECKICDIRVECKKETKIDGNDGVGKE